MSNKDKYKDTVFLPKTDFPMRGGLPQKEPEILNVWRDDGLYSQIRDQNKGKPKWVLHDGPAYANGNIHMGHAVNKILKDVTIKSYSMLGFDAPYIPGSDCHGLPIEWKVEQKYRDQGKTKDDIHPLDLRAECRAFAKEWSAIQGDQTQRLGVLGRWDDPYMTMANKSEGIIVREIHKFVKNGGLYKGSKPVMWSVVEQTALAEAEVEYKEHKSITIWVRFPITKASNPLLEGADVVIWTTTPWTIPSNKALAYGEHIEYGVYEFEHETEKYQIDPRPDEMPVDEQGKIIPAGLHKTKIVLATSLADSVKEDAKIASWELLGTLSGKDIAGTLCAHPLAKSRHPEREAEGSHAIDGDFSHAPELTQADMYNTPRPLLAADFVTDDAGTGFVHIAPSHGEDDYFLFLQHFGAGDIPDNVADDGKYRDHVPLFAGLEVYTQKGEMGGGNFAVLKALAESGNLLAKGSVRHEYPHSWRSGAPLIYRTTPQWFISMSKNDLRDKAISEIENTTWIPAKGEARIKSMIANRPDWCISRQRVWGVPIALFVHKETDEILRDEAVLTRIGDIFEEEGADAWWKRPASDFLGNGYNADDYHQIFDTADVWFDSASTHAIVLEQEEGLHSPADLYLEGSDQHRGWFHSSLLESVGTRGHAPYKSVLTHGFVLDEKGYKMSKSKGNVVDPLKMMDQYGADILRLWAMTSDFSEDIRIGKDSLKNTGDLYRRIRNTLRFLLGAIDGFTKSEQADLTDVSALPELEQLVLHQLFEMDVKMREHIENYDFMKLTKGLHDFCNENLSAFYFDIRKDSLYCDAPDNDQRRITRTVMAKLFECLTAWLAPVLAFTTEEAWSHRPTGVFEDKGSVHLREFPSIPKNWHNAALAGKWFAIRELREKVTAAIEPLRADKTIGSSLEALPILTLDENMAKAVEGQNLPDIFITSDVRIEQGGETTVKIEKTPGEKCVRCWKTLPEVAQNDEHLCNRCEAAVKSLPKEKAA
ncbi:MAG: isoleucine--tRNA ligase [Alphaproteobacteria bacterium]|nr:isoleucine--tRNA ligase [Alphaproteobacteria bacterium]